MSSFFLLWSTVSSFLDACGLPALRVQLQLAAGVAEGEVTEDAEDDELALAAVVSVLLLPALKNLQSTWALLTPTPRSSCQSTTNRSTYQPIIAKTGTRTLPHLATPRCRTRSPLCLPSTPFCTAASLAG